MDFWPIDNAGLTITLLIVKLLQDVSEKYSQEKSIAVKSCLGITYNKKTKEHHGMSEGYQKENNSSPS